METTVMVKGCAYCPLRAQIHVVISTIFGMEYIAGFSLNLHCVPYLGLFLHD